MAIVNFNLTGGIAATLKEMEAYSHKKSYWARVVRKDGFIEYKYINYEEKDHEKLMAAIKSGDVQHVMAFEGKELVSL